MWGLTASFSGLPTSSFSQECAAQLADTATATSLQYNGINIAFMNNVA